MIDNFQKWLSLNNNQPICVRIVINSKDKLPF